MYILPWTFFLPKASAEEGSVFFVIFDLTERVELFKFKFRFEIC